jgi:hypothetical protein
MSTVIIQSFVTVGVATNIPQDRKEQVYQFTDSPSYLRGNHGFKFGADVRRVSLTSFVPFDFRGTYTYPNLNAFALNNPSSVVKVYGDPEPTFEYWESAFFAQDDRRRFSAESRITPEPCATRACPEIVTSRRPS